MTKPELETKIKILELEKSVLEMKLLVANQQNQNPVPVTYPICTRPHQGDTYIGDVWPWYPWTSGGTTTSTPPGQITVWN